MSTAYSEVWSKGAGFGFGIELTTEDSIPGIEFRATMLTSSKLYKRFEGEAYIPKIGDEKTHADFWYGYVRRTEDNFFGIGTFTPLSAKTNFDIERRGANAGFHRDFTGSLQAGVYVSYINSDAYGGQSSKSPATDGVFSNNPSVTPVTLWIPGLHSGSRVITYGLYAEYDRRNNAQGLTKGFYLYGRLGSVDGLETGVGEFSQTTAGSTVNSMRAPTFRSYPIRLHWYFVWPRNSKTLRAEVRFLFTTCRFWEASVIFADLTPTASVETTP